MYLNEQPLPDEKVKIDEGRITALATLRPGDNRVEFRLSNKWGTEPVVQTIGGGVCAPAEDSLANLNAAK